MWTRHQTLELCSDCEGWTTRGRSGLAKAQHVSHARTHTHRKHRVNRTAEAVKENSREHWRLELNQCSADL